MRGPKLSPGARQKVTRLDELLASAMISSEEYDRRFARIYNQDQRKKWLAYRNKTGKRIDPPTPASPSSGPFHARFDPKQGTKRRGFTKIESGGLPSLGKKR